MGKVSLCLTQDTACLGLVHGDDPERCYGEGSGRGVEKIKIKIKNVKKNKTMSLTYIGKYYLAIRKRKNLHICGNMDETGADYTE